MKIESIYEFYFNERESEMEGFHIYSWSIVFLSGFERIE